jgi:integrase
VASLSNIKGRFTIQFRVGKHRRTIRLGKVTRDSALVTKSHVEHLVLGLINPFDVPANTVHWTNLLGDELHAKLVKVGLVKPRAPAPTTLLGPYFSAFIKKRTDLKPRTVSNLDQVRAVAVKHFGEQRDLASITRGDVKDWHRTLLATYSTATVAMHVKKMRQLYADAIDHKLVSENPFLAVKAGSMSNPDRMRYIAPAIIQKVIAACVGEWRLLFALARFGGLRVPSETDLLRWVDVDFDKLRMIVRSPKTEHHQGKALRVVPIVPELEEVLFEQWWLREDGAVHVLEDLRNRNLRGAALDMIERAGVETWPRIFQNLRSSCETDFAAIAPLHVACQWIGNSTGVAVKHYLQVTEADFDKATGKGAVNAAPSVPKTPKPQADAGVPGESYYPQGEASRLGLPSGNLQKAHQALQAALHDARSNLGKERRRLIRNLTEAVKAAKGARP